MEYRRLGRSALAVSELCLGTMNLGDRTPEQESFEILDRSIDAGINFIDTADHYGGAAGVGATEALLGRWIAADPARRDRIVLATKVHEPMSDDVNDRGLSARHIRMACEASLRRLGVEHIDLYQMHHIDRAAPIDEIWQAMDQLISSGKITYVGSSNFPGWAIARASERAIAERRFGLVSEQHLYNLLERRAELEVLPASRAYGVGFVPWSPLAGGLLAGSATGRGGRRASDAAQRAREHHADQLDRFQCLCADAGEPESIVALAWLLQRPGGRRPSSGPGPLNNSSRCFVSRTCVSTATSWRVSTRSFPHAERRPKPIPGEPRPCDDDGNVDLEASAGTSDPAGRLIPGIGHSSSSAFRGGPPA